MDGRYALADPTSSVAAINMNDEFNFFGKKTYLWGRSFASFPQISDAPVQKEIVVPEPEPVVEEEEGSWWGNLGIGILATAALGGLAVLAFGAATVATGGAALVFVGVCLAGAAAGAATVTTVASYQDLKSGHTRTTSEFVSQLTAGAIKGATTSAMLYGMWHGIPAASQWLGGDLAMLFSGSVLSTLNFTKLSAGAGYLLMAAQGLRNSSEIVSIASGYNWVLENIFGGNVENYNGATALMDGISFQVVMVGLVNYLNRPKEEPVKALTAKSSDGQVDFYGRSISKRTRSILDRFKNAKIVEAVDERGNKSIIQVIDGLKKGEVKVKDLGNLQAVTGNEFSLFRGPNGERVLIQGDPTQISIPYKYTGEGWIWSGHSHPGRTTPSSNDKNVLKFFDQEKSMIKSATGAEEVFDSKNDMSNWLPGWED